MGNNNELKVGDKVYYVIKSQQWKGKLYDIVSSEVVEIGKEPYILSEGSIPETTYLIKYDDVEIYIVHSGSLTNKRFFKAVSYKKTENNTTDLEWFDGYFYTNLEDAIGHYQYLLNKQMELTVKTLDLIKNEMEGLTEMQEPLTAEEYVEEVNRICASFIYTNTASE
jgi:hypothetical protein